MSKVVWKPGTLLSPVPVVMVTSRDGDFDNIITLAWVGTVCSEPPMVSISIRPERYSYDIIKRTGEFVINIPDRNLMKTVDYCGVKSGRDIDKFKECNLTKIQADKVNCAVIKEAPIALECIVKETLSLGTHDMFIAEIVAVDVERSLIDKTGRLCLDKASLLCYNHGQYCVALSHEGKFGFSVQKKKTAKKVVKAKKVK
jgi:flavin reductase (DIM6/NTAB) family NADH-FMN oxidoreductase RutF